MKSKKAEQIKKAKENKEYYYRHKEQGLCIKCSRKAIKGLTACKEHRKKYK